MPTDIKERITRLYLFLQEKIQPIPVDWLEGVTVGGGSVVVTCLDCTSWGELVGEWRKALQWTEGLERALGCMLASVLSVDTTGEQLWLMVQSPPSTGKTTLAEGLGVCREFVLSKSTITGLQSGYMDATKADYSLMTRMNGKTFCIKDGDTLLKLPNREKVLSEFRDLYDGSSRASYKNGLERTAENHRCTVIVCGTSSLRELDSADLGARFLTTSIMEGIDAEYEHSVGMRVAYRAFRNIKTVRTSKKQSEPDPAILKAQRMTGGYVRYLRQNASRLVDRVVVSEDLVERVVRLGEFVAVMRARPPKSQDEIVEREFSARLVEQFCRLVACLAAVTGRWVLEEGGSEAHKVLGWARAVALHTARGRTLTICDLLHRAGPMGMELVSLSSFSQEREDRTRDLLVFLKRIEAVEVWQGKAGLTGVKPKPRWRLTERVRELCGEVLGNGHSNGSTNGKG